MSHRNAASLTASLLVPKGRAAPSPHGREASPDAPTRRRFTPKLAPSPVTLAAANDKPAKAAGRNGKPRAAPSGEGPSRVRRFTLRLSREQHLRLRLASVHLGRSGQKLLLEALDEYLGRIAPELREGNCACLLEGLDAPPRGKRKPA